MYTSDLTLLMGVATDRIWGPWFAGILLAKLRLGDIPKDRPRETYTYDNPIGHEKQVAKFLADAIKSRPYAEVKEWWDLQLLGDSADKLGDWKKLAGMSWPTRESDELDTIFTGKELPHITPWFRTNLFSCRHSNRKIEQTFSVHTHLADVHQSEDLKEELTLYHSMLGDFRLSQLQSDIRKVVSKLAAPGLNLSKESALLEADKSRAQLRLHAVQMFELAKLYESCQV